MYMRVLGCVCIYACVYTYTHIECMYTRLHARFESGVCDVMIILTRAVASHPSAQSYQNSPSGAALWPILTKMVVP